MEQQFLDAFGGLRRAYGTYRLSGETNSKGKAEGRGTTVAGELTAALWAKHLAGEQRLGVVPVTDEGTARFGAIDVDQYPLDLEALEHRVKVLGLPLTVCRSKSGGAHLYLFTHNASAKAVVETLTKWAAALGYPGVEVFPKQTQLASETDVGNWINMPYFDADVTMTYALQDGQPMTAGAFLARADALRVSEEALLQTQIQGPQLPDGAPPCLMAIAMNGAPEGTRNNAAFAFGVLARQVGEATGEDWGDMLHEFNQQFMDPPLPPSEVAGVAKSLGKKGYFYPCDNAPLSSYCDKRACRRAAFGVGGGDGPDDPGLLIDGVVKIKTDPPTWIFRIAGANVEMDTDDFLSQTRFKRKVAEKLNRIPRSLKQHKWETLVNELLANVEEEEAPEDASSHGQFLAHLADYCNRKSRTTSEEALATSGLYLNEEQGRVYFRGPSLEKYLQQQKFYDVAGKRLWAALRKVPGIKHGQKIIKGRNISWWSIPAEAEEAEEFTVPRVEQEEF